VGSRRPHANQTQKNRQIDHQKNRNDMEAKMINAIAEIGKYEKTHNPDINSNFDIWLEDSYDEKKYPHLLLIEFENIRDNNTYKWVYNRIDYYQHSTKYKSRILYKAGKGKNAPDITPTSKVTEIEKTFNKKIKKWFQQNENAKFINPNEKEFLREVNAEMEFKADLIIQELQNRVMDFNKGCVLSVAFRENDNQKLLSDYPLFSKFINTISVENFKYSKTSGKYSFAENQLCAICRSKKPEVYGYFSSLKFYNVDKPGMVTGGFDPGKSWKNYPICLDCALDVEMGIKVLDDKLLFNFYGLRYYLIPKTATEKARNEVLRDIYDFKKSPKIKDKDREKISNAEDEVFEILKEEQNNVTFSMLFFDKPQKSVFRILALIEDVLPSRFKELFRIKKILDDPFIFKYEKSKEEKIHFKFDLGIMKNLFPYHYKKQKLVGEYKSYLQCIESIFYDIRIDYQFIIQKTIKSIRTIFINQDRSIDLDEALYFHNSFWKRFEVTQYHLQTIVLTNFMLIIFLNELNLFRSKHKEESMNRQFYDSFEILSKEEFEEKTDLFFDSFREFFSTDIQRSIFLIGVLTQFLLKIQKSPKVRGATPFRSKLKGLKMDGRDIIDLVPEIIEKLEQYNKNYYFSLEKLISKYLLSAGDYRHWNLSVDEMNFIFVLGMSLSEYFEIKSKKVKNEEIKNEQN
jgi:CRISPR-associated protein Csh1